MPDCHEAIPMGVYLLGVGIGVFASIPTVAAAWFVGRQGRREALAKLGELVR